MLAFFSIALFNLDTTNKRNFTNIHVCDVSAFKKYKLQNENMLYRFTKQSSIDKKGIEQSLDL
jgi:hypothetical protein